MQVKPTQTYLITILASLLLLATAHANPNPATPGLAQFLDEHGHLSIPDDYVGAIDPISFDQTNARVIRSAPVEIDELFLRMMPPIATFETQSISPNTFRVGDVNNDGIPDLIFSSSASGIAVLLGQTDGTFEPTDTSPIAFSGILRSMALGDMTGNGNLDVVILDNAYVLVMEGLGNGGFSEPQFLAAAQEVGSRIELVDLTDNGHLDIRPYPDLAKP